METAMSTRTVDRTCSVGGHEICPLCLGRYAASAECICVVCEAPSCPDCAELISGTSDALCYACHVPTTH